MVSFQCEACGDVLTKKKLDPHRGRCHGAYFSCLDCMVTFQGTEYRAHTSCISEAQKYQGALYKEKPSKAQKRKSVTIAADAVKHKSRDAYVEDAPDVDDKSQPNPPPSAPSPPPATPALPASTSTDSKPVNVFDFLDPSATPTASNVSASGKEQMKMVSGAPSVFDPPKQLTRYKEGKDDEAEDYDVAYEENGFSYGTGPIPPAPTLYNQASNVSMEFTTPAPQSKRRDRGRRDQPPPSLERSASSVTGTSDKKRKRGQPEELSVTRYEDDVSMVDAPSVTTTPTLNHSGLTGGLSQMMRMHSPDYRSDHDNDDGEGRTHPVSPVKRTRRGDKEHGRGENGLGISGVGQKLMSLLGNATGVTGVNGSSNDPSSKALVRTRRHSSSDDGEKARKAARKHKHRKEDKGGKETEKEKRKHKNGAALVPVNGNEDSDDSSRRLKAIEYQPDDRSRSPQDSKHRKKEKDKDKDKDKQLVLYKQADSDDQAAEDLRREKAALFLSLINKGPESERGCSMHKALKRFHREYSSAAGSEDREQKHGSKERGRGRSRHRGQRDEEEQELWRMLRLKRNDRGEVVVFI
ncbi:hypothetical protein VTO42DRAFT_5418 [Malbranchea cinnamomea]